jgi:hypothetical protein
VNSFYSKRHTAGNQFFQKQLNVNPAKASVPHSDLLYPENGYTAFGFPLIFFPSSSVYLCSFVRGLNNEKATFFHKIKLSKIRLAIYGALT